MASTSDGIVSTDWYKVQTIVFRINCPCHNVLTLTRPSRGPQTQTCVIEDRANFGPFLILKKKMCICNLQRTPVEDEWDQTVPPKRLLITSAGLLAYHHYETAQQVFLDEVSPAYRTSGRIFCLLAGG
jgi:hypothetical protein